VGLRVSRGSETSRLSGAVDAAVGKLPPVVDPGASREQLTALINDFRVLGAAMTASGAQQRADLMRLQELMDQQSLMRPQVREARALVGRLRACDAAGDRARAWIAEHGSELRALAAKLGESEVFEPMLAYSLPAEWLELRATLRRLERELDAYLGSRPFRKLLHPLGVTLIKALQALERRLGDGQTGDQ